MKNIQTETKTQNEQFRQIELRATNEHIHWVGNGFRVKQIIPLRNIPNFMERFSPFLLMDYNEKYLFSATDIETGVGPHPHRGFETVTLAIEGKVAHGDNQGNYGVINSGDIQWMTAGSGILHKEYHEKEFAKNNRFFHLVQLWVDLPREHKMTTPKYQALTSDIMGKYEEEGVVATIFAGEHKGVKGPASTFSPINLYKIDMKDGAKTTITEPASFNTGILMVGGTAVVNEYLEVKDGELVLFVNDGKPFEVRSTSDETMFIVLSGEPLNQPVFAGGPFVMCSKEDLMKANIDFQMGKFGSFDF